MVNWAQKLVDAERTFVPVLLEDVPVAVHGEAGAAVAQPLGDALDVQVVGNEQGGVHMPEGMDGGNWYPGFLLLVLEDVEQIPGVDGGSDLGGEDQAGFGPASVALFAFLLLPVAVGV